MMPGMAQHSATVAGEPIGVVIVGAGFIAAQHDAAIRATSGVELVGVVDVDAGRAQNAAREAGGVRWSADLAEALAWPGVGAAVVCTPNATHEAIGRQVAAAGKHMLIEKPLATTVAAAQRLTTAFDSAGCTMMAAHTHRFYDYARTIKDEIEAGAIGRPVFARLALLGGWIWPDWRAWMIDAAKSGGHALHNGVHLLDLVTWWLDDRPVSVYARGRKQTASELDVYDYLEMSVEFEAGGTAVCEMSRGHRPTSLDRREVLVLGTDGMLTMPPDQWGAPTVTEAGTSFLPPTAANGFVEQLQAWLAAIAGEEAAMTSADAVQAVALGVAVERSIESGQPVSVDGLGGGGSGARRNVIQEGAVQ